MNDSINFSVVQKMHVKDIFLAVSRLIEESGVEKSADALSLIKKREELGATAIGGGVLVPHAKLDGIKTPIVSIGVLSEPIAYGGDSISIIILLLLPMEGTSVSLELLSHLVSAISTDEARHRVRNAENRKEIEEVFLG